MCGWEDLEPRVSKMIKNSDRQVERAHENINELAKELHDFKNHQERLNNNTENPFLETIKAILDEQVTMIYSVQGEMKGDMKELKDMQRDTVCQMADMAARIPGTRHGAGPHAGHPMSRPRNKHSPNTWIEKRQSIMAKKRTGQALDPADVPAASRSSSPLLDGASSA